MRKIEFYQTELGAKVLFKRKRVLSSAKGRNNMKFKKNSGSSREVGSKQSPLKKASMLPIRKALFFKNEWVLVFLKLRTKYIIYLCGSERRIFQKRLVAKLIAEISSENAGMFSSVNNFKKLCRKPKVSVHCC